MLTVARAYTCGLSSPIQVSGCGACKLQQTKCQQRCAAPSKQATERLSACLTTHRKLSSTTMVGMRLRRGYTAPGANAAEVDLGREETDDFAARVPVDKLVLVVHGIGQVRGFLMRHAPFPAVHTWCCASCKEAAPLLEDLPPYLGCFRVSVVHGLATEAAVVTGSMKSKGRVPAEPQRKQHWRGRQQCAPQPAPAREHGAAREGPGDGQDGGAARAVAQAPQA